jgi:hypothetical protein
MERRICIWRFDGSQETFQSDQFMSSKFLDLYVVYNNVNCKDMLGPRMRKLYRNAVDIFNLIIVRNKKGEK